MAYILLVLWAVLIVLMARFAPRIYLFVVFPVVVVALMVIA